MTNLLHMYMSLLQVHDVSGCCCYACELGKCLCNVVSHSKNHCYHPVDHPTMLRVCV